MAFSCVLQSKKSSALYVSICDCVSQHIHKGNLALLAAWMPDNGTKKLVGKYPPEQTGFNNVICPRQGGA